MLTIDDFALNGDRHELTVWAFDGRMVYNFYTVIAKFKEICILGKC